MDSRPSRTDPHAPVDRGTGPWTLRLICCGRDDGIERYATWREADAFRWSYIDTGPSRTGMGMQSGHDRTAILTREEPNGQ